MDGRRGGGVRAGGRLPWPGVGTVLVLIWTAAAAGATAAVAAGAAVTALGWWWGRPATRRWRRRSARLLRSTSRAGGDPGPVVDGGAVLICGVGRLMLTLEARSGTGPPADPAVLLPALLGMAAVRLAAVQWVQMTGSTGGPVSRSWLIAAFELDANGDAVAARGGGSRGGDHLARATATRMAASVSSSGYRLRLLDAAPAAVVWAALPAGVRPTAVLLGGATEDLLPGIADGGDQHRLLRWRPAAGADPVPAALHPPPGVRWSDPSSRVVSSTWARAGPGGVRCGGELRLTASTAAGLAVLECEVRQSLGAAGAQLVDDDHRRPLRRARRRVTVRSDRDGTR